MLCYRKYSENQSLDGSVKDEVKEHVNQTNLHVAMFSKSGIYGTDIIMVLMVQIYRRIQTLIFSTDYINKILNILNETKFVSSTCKPQAIRKITSLYTLTSFFRIKLY